MIATPSTPPHIRILIADDHPIVREGLVAVIDDDIPSAMKIIFISKSNPAASNKSAVLKH